ncbi:MAG: Clp protease N-terminal domain-containing protein, partial [Candidatus Diapherotrites archaeon]|nr:Clp protease N-terminal domain-containing protein [Candidatus Diapherotrites archaeon]
MQAAQMIAADNGQHGIEPIHLLASLLAQDDGIVLTLLEKLHVGIGALQSDTMRVLDSLPRSANVETPMPGQIFLTPPLAHVVNTAAKKATQFSDEYISTEHLFLALLDDKMTGVMLDKHEVAESAVLDALKELRGNQHVDSAEPEAKYQA